MPAAALGGLGGAGLLLVSPADSFEKVVPFLVAAAAVLMLPGPRIRSMRSRGRPGARGEIGPATAVAMVFACAYGGYFGAAAGVLILALLISTVAQPVAVSNALKNVMLGAANLAGAVLFAFFAPVEWAAVPPLLVGCVVGGRIGPPVVRRLPEAVVRWTVGVAGCCSPYVWASRRSVDRPPGRTGPGSSSRGVVVVVGAACLAEEVIRGPSYELVRPAGGRALPPTLDEHQRRVVEHPSGPLLVLAGPGTGKTTTLVEAIVDRVEVRGADPTQVLALTFSRKAAEQLRDRVTARLGRTLTGSLSSTFHSFAYGLVRAYAPADLYAAPLRLLSAPEQDVVLQQLLTKEVESVQWPPQLATAVGTRGFAREVSSVLARARERGLSPQALVDLGPILRPAGARRLGVVPGAVPRRPRRRECDRLPRPDQPSGDRGRPAPR